MLQILYAISLLSQTCPCTPMEMWAGRKPDVSKLRVLGCKAFCQIDKSQRGGKFAPVAYKGVLVNYNSSSNAYRVWDQVRHKVYNVGEPAFDESAPQGWWRQPSSSNNDTYDDNDEPVQFSVSNTTPDVPSGTLGNAQSSDNSNAESAMTTSSTPTRSPGAAATSSATQEEPPVTAADPAPLMTTSAPTSLASQPTSPRRSSRTNRGVPPLRLAEIMLAALEDSAPDDPKTFKQAMQSTDAAKWTEACAAEVASLIENNVYSIVDRPQHKQTVTSKWIFKKKRGMTGEVEKYKARLVARGFTQEEGIDYTDTFSPTVRFESIRIMLAETAAHGLHTAQMDVTTAFLYADLKEEVYLEIPDGMFEAPMAGKVLRLWKALYGLKQSSRMWNLHIDNVLGKFGLLRLTADFCIYVIGEGESRVVLGLYVDDMFIMAALLDKLGAVKVFLHSNFRMKDLGEVKFLLGMEIRKQPDGDIHLVQQKYLTDVLAKFNMTDCKAVSTPLPPGSKLSQADSPKTEADRQQMQDIPYRSAIGSLMYLAVCTRPDISAAISSLSRFNGDPGLLHWEGVLHVLQYLKGTMESGIRYKKGCNTEIWGFCDSSHLTCPDTGRSRAGFVFLSAGGAVSWQSKLVPNASLSSCESEYMALSMAGQEASYLRQLQMEILGTAAVPKPIRVLLDSQPAIDIVHNPVYHARSKQILAKYHFVRDRVHIEKEMSVEKCSASQMGADMLTKHASVAIVRYNRKLLGMI